MWKIFSTNEVPHKNLCIKLRHFRQDNRIEQDDIVLCVLSKKSKKKIKPVMPGSSED